MPLVPLDLFATLYPAIQKAAEEAMLLTLRGLDPEDKTKDIEIGVDPFPKKLVSVDCSKTASPISNISRPNDLTVVKEKAADLFGVAFAGKLTPVLVLQLTGYVKTAEIIVPPGQAVATAGSQYAQVGVTTAPSPPAIIL